MNELHFEWGKWRNYVTMNELHFEWGTLKGIVKQLER